MLNLIQNLKLRNQKLSLIQNLSLQTQKLNQRTQKLNLIQNLSQRILKLNQRTQKLNLFQKLNLSLNSYQTTIKQKFILKPKRLTEQKLLHLCSIHQCWRIKLQMISSSTLRIMTHATIFQTLSGLKKFQISLTAPKDKQDFIPVFKVAKIIFTTIIRTFITLTQDQTVQI